MVSLIQSSTFILSAYCFPLEYYDSVKNASHTIDAANFAHSQVAERTKAYEHEVPTEKLFFTIAKLRRQSSPWYKDDFSGGTSVGGRL